MELHQSYEIACEKCSIRYDPDQLVFLKQVKQATQQKYIHRLKRDGIPSDPKFGEMWYLVSIREKICRKMLTSFEYRNDISTNRGIYTTSKKQTEIRRYE